MRRLLAHLLVSALLWSAIVGAAYWWLMRELAAADARGDMDTRADSPGLPLLAVAILGAVVLLGANLAIVAARRWRRRPDRRATPDRPRAT